MVSILIPTIRTAGLQRCVNAAKMHAGVDLDVQFMYALDSNRIGCPKILKYLVERSKFDLVMFLGDDTIPQQDYLIEAINAMASLPGGWGLVGLNDGFQDGTKLATHWLASKKLLPLIGGEFFHTGYLHTFCDNELTERCKVLGRYVWAVNSKIEHDHPLVKGTPADADYQRVYSKKYQDHDNELFLSRRHLWIDGETNKKGTGKDIKNYTRI